jgi:hypothetical protein
LTSPFARKKMRRLTSLAITMDWPLAYFRVTVRSKNAALSSEPTSLNRSNGSQYRGVVSFIAYYPRIEFCNNYHHQLLERPNPS